MLMLILSSNKDASLLLKSYKQEDDIIIWMFWIMSVVKSVLYNMIAVLKVHNEFVLEDFYLSFVFKLPRLWSSSFLCLYRMISICKIIRPQLILLEFLFSLKFFLFFSLILHVEITLLSLDNSQTVKSVIF